MRNLRFSQRWNFEFFWVVTPWRSPCSLHFHFILKMDVAWSFKTLLFYQNTTWRHNAVELHLGLPQWGMVILVKSVADQLVTKMSAKLDYRVHKKLQLHLILRQLHLTHTLTPSFPNINFNIILPSSPRWRKRSLPLMLSDQNVTCPTLQSPLI
jgi:hypothetical protein